MQSGIRRGLLALACLSGLAGAARAADVVYTYDAIGRVKTVAYPTGKLITYTYDAAGNRVSVITTP